MENTHSIMDEFEITKLVNHYANLNDLGQWQAISELYTTEGQYCRPTAPDEPIIGRGAILASFTGRGDRVTRHVVSNIVVDLIGESRAQAFSVILLFAGVKSGGDGALPTLKQGMPLVGTFEDQLIKKDGQWLFTERRGGLTFAKA